MSKKNGYAKAKGRGSERFVKLPFYLLEHGSYTSLSNSAKALLIDFLHQYNGSNNGDLCAAPSTMKERGWKAPDTVTRARYELEAKGWIVITRVGGKNRPNLFAVTMHPIDDCKDKLDRKSTRDALHYWKAGNNPEISSPAQKWFNRNK